MNERREEEEEETSMVSKGKKTRRRSPLIGPSHARPFALSRPGGDARRPPHLAPELGPELVAALADLQREDLPRHLVRVFSFFLSFLFFLLLRSNEKMNYFGFDLFFFFRPPSSSSLSLSLPLSLSFSLSLAVELLTIIKNKIKRVSADAPRRQTARSASAASSRPSSAAAASSSPSKSYSPSAAAPFLLPPSCAALRLPGSAPCARRKGANAAFGPTRGEHKSNTRA